MSDIIHLLPDSVANQIAAGEVIQRPASVVKELVENAIDAGATTIQVVITDSGKTSIQVVDDGKGMSETDARIAFERHATSKIKQASDLFALRTMGFRGEALASIAAVAQVELRSRMSTEELGTCIQISGSKVESQEPISCAVGSNFFVRNLFYNVPARRKFLKSNSTELSNILNEFERMVLVHPDIAFTLHSNDTEVFNLPSTNLRQRIMSVFGKKLNQQLLDVEVETTLVKLTGFIAKPESARKKGAHQYFFVNGRYMRHPYFHKAVMEAYEHLIPIGEQISYFLYFDVDPANIDVNIHPTKTEIKFENEQAIWQIITAAIRESLGRFSAVPSIDFDTEDMPEIPSFEQGEFTAAPKVAYNEDYNPFKGQAGSTYKASKPSSDWDKMYAGLEKNSKMNKPLTPAEDDIFRGDDVFIEGGESVQQTSITESEALEKSSQHLQFKGRFILTSVKSGLMLIDQRRAHIRVLFDRYMQQMSIKQGASQRVLFPEVLQLPPSEATTLCSILDNLYAIGFDLSDLGSGSYAINGVPAGIEGLNPIEVVRDMVHSTMEKGTVIEEEIQQILALTLAQSAAIVHGQVLSSEEMVGLVDALFACASPNYTPDGKLVLTLIKEDDIEKMFR